MLGWRSRIAVGPLALVAIMAVALLWPRPSPAEANPLTGVAAVAAGDSHTCALTTAGGVKCWGNNNSGQLGDGTTARRSTPGDVSGLTGGVAAVAAGSYHTCAVTTAGGLKCWGNNDFGQLGDGTTAQRSTPVDVSGLTSGVAAVAAGGLGEMAYHTCAVTTAGGLKCWGNNDFGQLGDGTTAQRTTPVDVSGLTSGVAAVAVGGSHTCALTTAGGVQCWGRNDHGQLGGETTEFCASLIGRPPNVPCSRVPVDVSGLTSGVAAVAAGEFHTCAVTTAGALQCWGDNGSGQLGDGTKRQRPTPVSVIGPESDVTAVAAGAYHTCAVATGGAKCWGFNGFGQLGDGTTANHAAPADVSALTSGVADIAAGAVHVCALTTAGGVKCWGSNDSGQLGDGTGGSRRSATPVDVVELGPKPTPTGTPCPPEGCPSPTSTPTPTVTPTPGGPLDFSLGIDVDGDGADDCGTTDGAETTCSLSPGSAFVLNVYLNSLGIPSYEGFDLEIEYAGVRSKDDATTAPWPECAFPASFFADGLVALACVEGYGQPGSTYTGLIASGGFHCTGPGTITMVHGSGHTQLVDHRLREHAEGEGTAETLIINCGPLRQGDVDCSAAVNSIDATLVLQFHAGLTQRLPCPQHADVNQDAVVNSIDAFLYEQFHAGLINSLPP